MKYKLLLIILFAVSFNSFSQWTNLPGPPGGYMNDLEVDPSNTSKAYSVVNNNLYVTTNDGTSWTKIVPTTPSTLYIADFMIDGSTWFALYYSQLYSSTDGGANWTRINANGSFDGAYKMIKIATNTYAVYGYNGVYVSKDSGVNWVQIGSVYATSAVANANGDLFFSDLEGIKRHLAPGSNPWASGNVSKATTSNQDYDIRLGVMGTGSGTLFVMTSNGTGGIADVLKIAGNAVWPTTVSTSSPWSSVKSNITDGWFYNGSFANSAAGLYLINNNSNPGTIWFTTTASAGASWSSVAWPSTAYGSTQVNVLRFANGSSTKAYAGTSGDGVFVTTNTGTSWALASGGIYLADAYDVIVAGVVNTNPRIIVRTGNYSKGFWYSDDKGATWTFSSNLINSAGRMTKMPNGTLLAYGNGNTQYSTNNGVGWTTSSIYSDYVTYNATFSPTNKYVYGMSYAGLLSSKDGITWTGITVTGLPTSYSVYGLAQDNAGHIYSLVYNGNSGSYEIYKIILAANADNATTATAYKLTFTLLPNDQSNFYPSGVIVNNSKLYVGSQNGIYISTDVTGTSDGTGTFSSVVFSNSGIISLPNANGICASTFGALYVTSDDGLTWTDNALPSSDGYIRALAYDATNTTYYGAGYNTPALKDVASTLLPSSPPAYINFNWAPTNGPWGGYINRVLVDNANNSYVLSSNNSIYKTTTFASWTQASSLPNSDYMYAADLDKVSGKLYALAWSKIYSSSNGGSTWTLVNGSENFGGGYNLKYCSNGDIVLGDWNNNGKVYVSTNGGTTFGAAKYTLTGNNYIRDIQVTSTATPGIFLFYYDYTSSTTKITRSIDRGVTWADLTTTSLDYIEQISVNGTTLFATGSKNATGYDVLKSTDNGTTWTSIKGDVSTNHSNLGKVYLSPANELYMQAYNGLQWELVKSINGGANWTSISLNAAAALNDLNWVGTRLEVGTDQGVYTSDDGGVTFTNRSTGIPAYINTLQLASPSKLYAGNGSQEFTSSDFQNWNTSTNSFLGFTRKPDGTLLAFDNSKLYQTTEGNTWTVISSGLPYMGGITTADGTSYYGFNYNQVYYSNNLSTWTPLNPTGLPQNFSVNDISVDQNGIVYVTLYNYVSGIYEAYQILFGNAVKITQPKNPGNVEFIGGKTYLYDQTGALYTTTDGTAWTKLSAPAGNKLIIASLNYYFIPSYGGNLWLSRDQGQTWQNVGLGSGNANYNFTDVVVNEYNGYAYGAINGSPVRKSQNIVIPSDLVAPAVTTVSPVNNATGISLKPSLSITFDQAAVAVAGKYLRIVDVANQVTPVEIIDVSAAAQSGKTFTFTPVNFLSFNKTYFIIVDNGAFKDIFANAWTGITSNTTWRFTTKLSPTLNTVSPANSATNVNVSPPLSMTFSEGMNVIGGKNLYIYDAAQTSTPYTTIATSVPVNDFATIIPASASPDQSITVIFDASKGGGELVGANKVYMHSGAVTSGAASTTWNYVVGNWGMDDGVGQMTAVSGSPNVWQITLSPTMRQYFSVPNGTAINRLAMVFRSSNGSLKATPPATVTGATVAQNGDLFINLGSTILPSINSSGSTVNIFSTTPLQYGKQYFVKWDATSFQTVQEGYPLSFDTNNTDWVFNTRSAPTVTTLLPANSATNVDINAANTKLAITLSENFSFASGKKLYVTNTASPATPVYSIALTGAVFSGATATITLPGNLTYSTVYSITFDPNSFVATSDGGTFSLLTASGWQFTAVAPPDTQAPVITHTAPTIDKSASGATFNATITDNVGVAQAKIFYRSITANTAFTSADLTLANNQYSINLPSSTYSTMPIGIEYYITAADAAANASRAPGATTNFYAYYSFSGNQAPTIPSSAMGTGGTVGDWRIMSIPYKLTDPQVSTVFSSLGTSDFSKWRLITYKDQTAWDEYPTNFNSFSQGKGYFINVKTSPPAITLSNASSPSNNQGSQFQFVLKPGWNMIGNPYNFPMEWTEVLNKNSNPSGIATTIKTYNGNYVDVGNSGKLEVFYGAFVLNSSTSSVTLNVPITGKYAGGRIAAPAPSADISNDLANDNWVAPIILKIGKVENTFGGVGMNREATVGVDQFDDFNPPRWFEYAEMSFAHPEHFLKASTRDVVPTQQEYNWSFNVNTNVSGVAELTWDNSKFGFNSKELFIVDLSAEKLIDMRKQNTYSFDPKKSNSFKIYYGENLESKIKPQTITLGDAYPNPSNDSKVTIPFTLPEGQAQYYATIEVYDVIGKKMCTLVSQSLAPGFYTTEWEPTQETNSGIYFYRMKANGNGASSVLTKKIVVTH